MYRNDEKAQAGNNCNYGRRHAQAEHNNLSLILTYSVSLFTLFHRWFQSMESLPSKTDYGINDQKNGGILR